MDLAGIVLSSRARICKPLRSPGIDSQPGGIDSLELIPELLKRLQMAAQSPYFKRLWSPGIDSKELIPPVYVARRAGTTTLFLLGS
jgi:hypothetical protein